MVRIGFVKIDKSLLMNGITLSARESSIKPKVLYPYHYGDTDPSRLVDLMKDVPEIEVRIRKMR